MTAYQAPEYRTLMRKRRQRIEDLLVRTTMGLTHAGYIYCQEDWRVAARELYRACDGIEYVRMSPGIYVKRDSIKGRTW